MNVLHALASGRHTNAVQLIGIGAAGRHFVQQFHSKIEAAPDSPLSDLLAESANFIQIEEGAATVERGDLSDAQILFLAFAPDIRHAEIEAAMLLIWRMWKQDGHVIGIVLGGGGQPVPDSDSMLGILYESIDARIDIADANDDDERVPLQWFYTGLRRSVLDGVPILEAAWDHADVIETLDLSQARLELFTQVLDEPGQLDAAMAHALDGLRQRGIWLEQAHGAVIVLWAPAEYRLTAQAVRGVGRAIGDAMGAGALHLTIRLPSRAGTADMTAYLTLVVSMARSVWRE